MDLEKDGRSMKRNNQSGATFRYIKGQNDYQKTPFLIKEIRNVPTHESAQYNDIVDCDVENNSVLYSLNKKGRWRLPEKLRDFITDCDQEDDAHVVSLYEYHKIFREANCIQYTTTSERDNKLVTPTSSMYVNIRSTWGKPKNKRRKRRRQRQAAAENPEDQEVIVEPKPEVVYSIAYPAPSESKMARSCKFTATYWPCDNYYHKGEKGQKGRNSRVSRRNLMLEKSILDEFSDEIDSGVDDEVETSPQGSLESVFDMDEYDTLDDYVEFNSGENVLELLLDRALKAKEIYDHSRSDHVLDGALSQASQIESTESTACSTATWEVADTNKEKGFSFYSKNQPFTDVTKKHENSSVDDYETQVDLLTPQERENLSKRARSALRKERLIENENLEMAAECSRHIENVFAVPEGDTMEIPNSKLAEMRPVSLIMDKTELQREQLREKYGDKYRETEMCHRRFIVDISAEVIGHLNANRRSYEKLGDFWTFLVFAFCAEYTEKQEVYSVSLNSELRMRSLKIETLFDLQICSMDEVLTAVLYYLDTLPDYCFPTHERELTRTKSSPTSPSLATLTSASSWNPVTFPSHQGYKSIMYSDTVNDDSDPIHRPSFDSPPAVGFCSICFVIIDDNEYEGIASNSLVTCQHWFCNDCWTSHLREKIESGSLKPLHCPEFDCDTSIDHTTSLSFIPASLYSAYLQRVYENRVQMSEDSVWCPNPKCGRVVKINADCENACVVCDCGYNFCLRCFELAHWPASCQDARRYHEKRVKLGDEDLIKNDWTSTFSITLQVKDCPRCHEPISKYGGCTHMKCRCGHEFCWNCRRPWPEETPCPVVLPTGLKYNQSLADEFGTRKVTFHDEDRLKMLSRYGRSPQYVMALEHCRERNQRRLARFRRQRLDLCKKLKSKLKAKKHVCEEISREVGVTISPDDQECVNAQVSSLIDSCVSLCVELHFIIEYTCVMLDSSTVKRHAVSDVLSRMVFIAERIHQIFEAGGTHENRNTFTRLSRLKTHAHNCIVQLVNIVANTDKLQT